MMTAEWHFGKRRPSGADHEKQQPGLVWLHPIRKRWISPRGSG